MFPLHFVMYKNLPKFSNSHVGLLINFFVCYFSFICSHFVLKNCSFHFLSLYISDVCIIYFASSSCTGHLRTHIIQPVEESIY